MKRFYKHVAVEPAPGGFAVHLDGKPIRTPGKAPLVLPSLALARQVAAEWDAQETEIRPHLMPMTGLSNAALDLMRLRRGDIVANTAAYAATDLLCYRAEAPQGLRARQDQSWHPLIDWAQGALGLRFVVTQGIIPVDQEPGLVETVRLLLDAYDDFTMVAAHKLTHGTGSVVLALAVVEGRLTAAEAFDISAIDEFWQEEFWGIDEEASEHRALRRQDIVDAAEFMALARAEP